MNIARFSNAFLYSSRRFAAAAALAFACADLLQAQPISVPNFSFELQSAAGFPQGANPNVDSWQKIAEPAYYTPTFGSFGIPWFGTAGVFIDSNPYGNHLGTQAGYILAVPQVTLFQDYDTSPTHEFDGTFEIGKAYNLTIGVFGKTSIAPGSTLELSLYYRDNLANRVKVGSTVITYSSTEFPITPQLNLIDYQVNVPIVQAGDAWAGQKIGIQLESTVSIPQTSFGNWDFDNVRLTAVPEPGTIALLGLGVGGLLVARLRRQV
jgi:PEP-CTERM motif